MATGRPAAVRDAPVLADLLVEIRGMRLDLRTIGERMAAHPEAPELRNALQRLALVEEREAAAQKWVAKYEAKFEALEREVHTLKTGSAVGGVTITATHKVAGAILSLIMMALVWVAARATAPQPTYLPPPPAQSAQSSP